MNSSKALMFVNLHGIAPGHLLAVFHSLSQLIQGRVEEKEANR